MMFKNVLKGNLVLQNSIIHGGYLIVDGERISGIFQFLDPFPGDVSAFFDYSDKYIAPGLIDLHLHGAMGKDVMDSRKESVRTIAEYQADNGVTGFLGSTMSAPLDSVLEAIDTIKMAAGDPLPSEVLGVYVEGPYLNTQKKGAHSASCIKDLVEKDGERLIDALDGMNAIISLAPEVGQNMEWVAKLKERGFVVAIGHSDATYDQAMESFEKGISHATHLFNAMSGFDHKNPGAVGAILDSEDITAEIIADGVHVHPAALRLAVARKGPEKICLITDSMKATGVGDGIYQWGEEEIEVLGKRATIRGIETLAGSVLSLKEAIRNMIEWTGVNTNQAINMASLNPAYVLGLEDEIGSIQTGKLANLTVLDREFNVVDTLLRGKSVLGNGKSDEA
jgi:N-acetylglucosamine-6-phosphate deacetylase